MSRPIIVEHARIIDPASGFDAVWALHVEDGHIAHIAAGAAKSFPLGVDRIDAHELVLAPGLIDMRVFTG